MNQRDKVFANRNLSDYEIEMISLVFEQNKLEKYLDDSYIYIFLEENGEIDIMRYSDEIVNKTCVDFCISPRQSIEYLYSEEEIEQEVAEMLYWADIGDYKKYVPVIEYNVKKGEEGKIYADYYFFAKDDIEAAEFMNRNAFFEYLFVENVDGD